MFDFLKRNLSTLKKGLNINTIYEVNKYGTRSVNIFNELFSYNFDLKKVKYVFKFLKNNCPSIFLEDEKGKSVLDYLMHKNYLDIEIIKYVYGFCRKYYPSLFLEKYNMYTLIMRPEPLGRYYFKFLIKHYPYIMIKKHRIVTEHNLYYNITFYYSYDFYHYDFPEVSGSTNNFILPLMMEIQN